MVVQVARRFRRGFFVFALGATLIAGSAFDVQANEVNAPKNDPTKVVLASGSGSYVCTPAGFGKKSRCYRR